MKLNRLETHDRLQHLIQDQAINITQGANDCVKVNPLSLALQEKSPYIYLFAHPRTAEDGVTKTMYWQPRLTKPKAQTNSYLFRAQSKTETVEVCWLLPPEETWPQYKKGNVTEHEIVLWCIDQYLHNRKKLEESDHDDFPDPVIQKIYRAVVMETKQQQQRDEFLMSLFQE